MPKQGMEPIRRQALIEATIAEIGATGTLDVTVSRIAGRAGVSSALAHHYFGGKEAILIAAMRHLLQEFGLAVRSALAQTENPRERVAAVVRTSFAPEQFRPATIACWLAFYVEAQRSEAARRLLRIYAGRLRSNLVHALRPLSPQAEDIAEGAGALIDGLYIRHALGQGAPDPARATALVEDYVARRLAAP